MNELLKIYVDNSTDVYLITEALIKQVTKRKRKGLPVEVNHLVNCSTMKAIICKAAKIQLQNERFSPSTAERKKVAMEHAKYIIECAEYEAKKSV